MEGRLDLLASLEEEGEQMLNTQPEGSQEVVRSQGKDLRRPRQLLADPTLLPAAALHPPTRHLPLATRVARIHLELGQDTDHQPTLAAPLGQMQPMGHLGVLGDILPGEMHVAQILLCPLKNLLRIREMMIRSKIRAFDQATVKDELVLLFVIVFVLQTFILDWGQSFSSHK